MGHYYAFCEKHKKFGNDYDEQDPQAEDKAWDECDNHVSSGNGKHGKVYVKYSSLRTSVNGNEYRYYTTLLKP